MKKQLLHLILPLISTCALAQDFQEISSGAGYNKQSFIHLASGEQTQVNNDAWDIAFSVGAFDAGVFINESAGTSQGQPLAAIELFDAGTDEFFDQPDPSQLTDFQLFNSEKSWSFGALNEAANPTDPFDFGWGMYDPTTHEVTGGRVFVVKLRNGQYRKLQVQSLLGTTYTFRYANLDGTGETVKTIDKTDHAGKSLAWFSFATGATADVEPAAGFDLLYCRYITPLDDGAGNILPYAVTGILSGNGVEVARADGVDPLTVAYDDWVDSLSTDLDVIGYDWKSFSGTTWSLDQDLVFFVKTTNGNVWKIQFVDFEGSATGTAVFEKTNLGGANAVGDLNSPLTAFDVFPNPAIVETNVVFTSKKADANASLTLFDLTDRVVFETKIQVNSGLNGYVLPVGGLTEGLYFVSLNVENQVFAKKVQVVR